MWLCAGWRTLVSAIPGPDRFCLSGRGNGCTLAHYLSRHGPGLPFPVQQLIHARAHTMSLGLGQCWVCTYGWIYTFMARAIVWELWFTSNNCVQIGQNNVLPTWINSGAWQKTRIERMYQEGNHYRVPNLTSGYNLSSSIVVDLYPRDPLLRC